MILFPLMCYDWKNRRIDFWKNRGLLILMVFNIFMTGSRLQFGTLLLGFFLCLINLSRNQFYNFIKVMIAYYSCDGYVNILFERYKLHSKFVTYFFSVR